MQICAAVQHGGDISEDRQKNKEENEVTDQGGSQGQGQCQSKGPRISGEVPADDLLTPCRDNPY